jgi:hypothetical protein
LRLIPAAVALVAVVALFPRPVLAWPTDCHSRKDATRIASGICFQGDRDDAFRVRARDEEGQYDYGDWRRVDTASVVYLPSWDYVVSTSICDFWACRDEHY